MVENKSHSGFQLTHGAYSRVLSLVLLAFVCYAATVEAAHRHGRVFVSADATSASGLNGSNGLASNSSGCTDCLICQLQHSFSTALISVPYSGTPQPFKSKFSTACTVALLLQSSARLCGRAPPLAS
jgi:hypothetical protein